MNLLLTIAIFGVYDFSPQQVSYSFEPSTVATHQFGGLYIKRFEEIGAPVETPPLDVMAQCYRWPEHEYKPAGRYQPPQSNCPDGNCPLVVPRFEIPRIVVPESALPAPKRIQSDCPTGECPLQQPVRAPATAPPNLRRQLVLFAQVATPRQLDVIHSIMHCGPAVMEMTLAQKRQHVAEHVAESSMQQVIAAANAVGLNAVATTDDRRYSAGSCASGACSSAQSSGSASMRSGPVSRIRQVQPVRSMIRRVFSRLGGCR